MAGSEDGDILALVEDICLADLERLVRHEVGNLRSSETQVDRSVVLCGGDGGVLCLCPVARIDHDHVRKGAHEGDVLHGLVGGSVLSEGDSCVRGSDLDVGLAVADLHADLVIDPAGHELCE